jgi:aryl-alcohol dehydrogenase-like predicted oxidoreductase
MDFNHGLFTTDPAMLRRLYGERALSRWQSEANVVRLKRARRFGAGRGLNERQVNIAYVLNQPFPVVGIVGPAEIAPLEDYIVAADMRLSEDDLSDLVGDHGDHGDHA